MSGIKVDNEARAEDVRWMTQTGENLSGVARRLGISADGVDAWCRNHDMHAELYILRSREPGDPTRMLQARERAEARWSA